MILLEINTNVVVSGMSDFYIEIFLFATAVVAGFIDTLAGGGGLITMPALLMGGVPPLAALGTNKLQGSMGTATATFMMIAKKRMRWSDVKFIMLASFVGSTIGAIGVQYLNVDTLSFIIPSVLILISVYFIFSPASHNDKHIEKISKKCYQSTVVPLIACYDGMFGPGTGSFFTLSGVSLRGHGFIDATAIAKGLNFASNIAALIIFIFAGKVVWIIGIVMMFGQFIGAWLGSHCLLKIRPIYLRWIVVCMCVAMLIKYTVDTGAI